MQIYPAIDVYRGQCVRLLQGDFDEVTTYSDDPILMAETFAQAGSPWIHVVDLSGAQNPHQRQFELIKNIIQHTALNIQTGGGIRSEAEIEQLFACGAKRIVLGSTSVEQPELVKAWLKKFGPEKLTLAFDVMIDAQGEARLTSVGWQKQHKVTLFEILESYQDAGMQHVMCTDIARDGMETGPNFDLYASILDRFPALSLQASGGIRAIADLQTLKKLNVAGAIIGRALYEQRFSLAEILQC